MPLDVIYYLYKIKQSYWLLRVAKNCDWSRKITPLSNLAIPKSVWYCVGELWLAILNSLLCLETDLNIRIGKQGYVLIFTKTEIIKIRERILHIIVNRGNWLWSLASICDNRFLAWESTSVKTWGNSLAVGILKYRICYRELSSETSTAPRTQV